MLERKARERLGADRSKRSICTLAKCMAQVALFFSSPTHCCSYAKRMLPPVHLPHWQPGKPAVAERQRNSLSFSFAFSFFPPVCCFFCSAFPTIHGLLQLVGRSFHCHPPPREVCHAEFPSHPQRPCMVHLSLRASQRNASRERERERE